jgi:hypothetical protein
MKTLEKVILSTIGMALFAACSPVGFSKTDAPAPAPGGGCAPGVICPTGTGTGNRSDSFNFGPLTNKVDILIVDDNSGSMNVEQANLAARFTNLVSGINGLDWQMAITNTDICVAPGAPGYDPNICDSPFGNIPGYSGSRGRFMTPLGANPMYSNASVIVKGDPNAQSKFNTIVQRNSEVGSGDERGIYSAYKSVQLYNTAESGYGDHFNFFRQNSALALIFLTDEDERSGDPAQYPLAYEDTPEALSHLVNTIWQGEKNMIVGSIIVKPGDSTCLNEQLNQGTHTASYGTKYDQLATMTNGVTGSICDNSSSSFTNVINQIAAKITSSINAAYITLPFHATMIKSVTFTGGPAVAWTWNGDTVITFANRPSAGTTVTVNYDYTFTIGPKPTTKAVNQLMKLGPLL